MFKPLLLVALLASSAYADNPTGSPQTPVPKIPPIFVPIAALYMNGDFLQVTQVGNPFSGLDECRDKLSMIIAGLINSANTPPGATVVGACLPVPAHTRPATNT